MSNLLQGVDQRLKEIIDADLASDGSQPIDHSLEDISTDVDGTAEMTLQDIYKQLILKEDIIIIIDAIDETRVRKGLSSIKAKENAKLRDNDLPTDSTTLEYIVHSDDELKKQKRIKLQIFLKQRPTVKIHKMIVADDM